MGRLANIVLVAHDDYDRFTSTDPTITLARNVVGQNVRTVVLDRRAVMKEREVLTVDVAAKRAKVNARYPLIISRYEKAIA